MSSRVPPSANPPANQPAAPARPRGTTARPAATTGSRPQLISPAPPAPPPPSTTEAKLWSGVDSDRSLEVNLADVEQRLAETDDVTPADGEGAPLREGEERVPLGKGWTGAKAALPRLKPVSTQQQTAGGMVRTNVSQTKLSKVGPLPTTLTGQSATELIPDAFALLKTAKDKGQLFVEDEASEHAPDDHQDVELADAVEECIRLCFGLRGVLRIGPGRDDANERIIVVTTGHGFSDVSLAKVPPSVHRFKTLIAIPFDLLPLKRER